MDQSRHKWWGLVLISVFTLLSVLFAIAPTTPAGAITTVPTKMNFQGRLTDASGNIMPDGTYNMTFRIFDASTAGTQQWSEVRAVSAGTGVQVTNGLFSVRLGDATSLPANLFTNTSLYFEIELPTPATATCSTVGCASYTEGPMTPRQPLASSAYAFNSDTLDGYDSADFAFVSGSNTFTQAQTINVASTGALDIQNGSGISLLKVDTSGGEVVIGSAANGISFTANGIVLSGSARGLKTVTLNPEYPGATFTGDGSNNTGTLSSDFCSTSLAIDAANCFATGGDSFNFYQWSTTQAAAQDYDIYVRYRLPSDYSSGSMSNLSMWGYSEFNDGSDSVVLSLFEDGSGTACSVTANAVGLDGEWNAATVASPIGACTLAANDYVTFRVRMAVSSNTLFVRAGHISFDYRSTF